MKRYLTVLLIMFMIGTSGCVQKKEVTTKETRNYIVYNLGKVSEDLTILKDNDFRNEDLLLCIFDGLIGIDEKGKIVPALAYEWKVSEDKLSYTFKIRCNAKWSDGSTIKPEDFVEFFKEMLKTKDNVYKEQLYCIFGAKDFAEGKTDFDKVAINAEDEKTLSIRLNYPCSDFLNILSQPMYVLRKDFEILKSWKSNIPNIAYSGAFIVKDVSANGEILLSKNESYWEKGNIKNNKIVIKNQESEEFSLADYKWSECDIIVNPPIKEVKESIEDSEVINKPYSNIIGLEFNLKQKSIIMDNNFRKCIGYCLDREDISQLVRGEELKSFTKDYSGKKAVFGKNKDLTKAKEYLSKSKYTGEEIRIICSSELEGSLDICNNIKKDLNKVGIEAKVEDYEEEVFREKLDNKEYDIAIKEDIVDNNYKLGFLQNWSINSVKNQSGYANWKYDDSLLKFKIEQNQDKAKQYLNLAEDILYEDMPCIPICVLKDVICKKTYIQGLEVSKRGNIILKKSYIDRTRI